MIGETVEESDFVNPWWQEKTKTKALPKAERLFKHYAQEDRHRLSAYTGYSKLYTNREIVGNDYLRQYTAAFSLNLSEYSRVPLNVMKIMIDAVHARLTRPAVAVEFLPAGGNQSLRTKAKQMTQFVQAQSHRTELREQESRAVLDSLVYGLGAIKTCPHPKVPAIDNFRVHPRDIFVDPVEAAANGDVTHMYQRQYVSRSRLAALFPDKAKQIMKAESITSDSTLDWGASVDGSGHHMVEVVEGWHKPSYDGCGDGKHIIFISDCVLVYDDYDPPDFPFSFVRWKDDPTLGFFGIPLSEELIGLHFDINTSILQTEKTIETMPKPYVLCPADAEVSEGQLGNVHGTIINYTGRAPQIVMPQSVPSDIVNYIESQWRRALQVSRLVAMGMPESAGGSLQSGQGVKDIVDVQSTELAPAFKKREQFLIRVAEQQMVAGKQLDIRLKGEGGFKTVARKDRNTVMSVNWSDMDLDPRVDSYVVQAQPTSALSLTFGSKLAEVKEMVGLGLIPTSRAFKLLDIPDLDSEMNLQNASLDYIERIMEEILDEGIFTPPEPTMDLRLALKVAQKNINLAQAMGVEDDRVTMLYDFLRSVSDLIQKEQEATRMQGMGMTPGVGGGPPALDITGQAPGAASLSGNVMGQI